LKQAYDFWQDQPDIPCSRNTDLSLLSLRVCSESLSAHVRLAFFLLYEEFQDDLGHCPLSSLHTNVHKFSVTRSAWIKSRYTIAFLFANHLDIIIQPSDA